MKKIGTLMAGASLLALPLVTSAQLATGGNAGQFQNVFSGLTAFISSTLLPFLMALAFLAFVWGMFKFFIVGGGNEEEKEKGKSLMIWGILGFILIISLFGIVNLFATSLGVEGQTLVIPTVPS